MFAGVLAGRWPPVATLADRLLDPEHAPPLRPATDRDVRGERITRLDLTVAAPAGTLTIRITDAS